MDLILRAVLETCFTGWGTVHLNGLLQAPQLCGGRAQEHNPSTVPEPRHLLSHLLCPYVTLASEKLHFSSTCCCFIWASSFGKRGACISLQRFLMPTKAQMSCRRLSTAHGSCMLETVQREENLLSRCRNFFSSSGKIFPHLEQHLKSILPGQRCKVGNSCLNIRHFLWVPCPWYVLFHALMWNLLVTDADGCRIKCTFLWLCQVDTQQRAQLEELTADSVQSQDCLRESFSFLKVAV